MFGDSDLASSCSFHGQYLIFISTEGSMSRVSMVAIYPHSTRLYLASDVICLVGISRPNPGTQSIKGIIRNRNCICFIFKRSYVNHRIAEIIRYIPREIKRPLEVQQLAKKSCMSVSHFTRMFKQEVGVSPVEFIKQERIRIAVLLLKQPGISIK